jgi:hypothetical protein
MVKFKIGFTIESETMFRMLSKFLPVDDLQVEEVLENPIPKQAKIAKMIANHQELVAPPKTKPRKQRNHRPIKIGVGANRIIMDLLSDGLPHRAVELKPLFITMGLSPNGVGSALEKMKKRDFIYQPQIGFWQLSKERQHISHKNHVV